MDPLTISLIAGTALGAGKGILDQQQEGRDRKAAAEVMKWSPWTGMQTPGITKANVLGSTMQGAGTGAALGQGIEGQGMYNTYLQMLMKNKAGAGGATTSDSFPSSSNIA